MRTRLVRVRRRPRGVVWAMIFLVLAMALYIRVSLPALRKMQTEETGAEPGIRVTREITIEALEIHLVSFGGYDVLNSAKVEAARYVSRGAAGYVLEKERLYVIGAGYAAAEEAERACSQLAASEGMACTAISLKSPSVTLRMTAGSAQIEAFSRAEQTVRETAGALGQLAVSVDRGEATAAQVKEVIKTHLAKMDSARAAMENTIMETGGPMIDEVYGMLCDMAGQMEGMLEETGAMALSSRLRYCHVDFRVRQIDMLNGLLAQ